MHERGLAFDIWGHPTELRRLGAIWTQLRGQWGGTSDPIHFEATSHQLLRSPRSAPFLNVTPPDRRR